MHLNLVILTTAQHIKCPQNCNLSSYYVHFYALSLRMTVPSYSATVTFRAGEKVERWRTGEGQGYSQGYTRAPMHS